MEFTGKTLNCTLMKSNNVHSFEKDDRLHPAITSKRGSLQFQPPSDEHDPAILEKKKLNS
ncbi:unnamed protein product [Citrullus colocynthis]|uniref:Uncharacterized protein n=1 Tax=Citrullus colocynthis TaxID=252529 RepID=A0ABP0ZCE9_9ROSI